MDNSKGNSWWGSSSLKIYTSHVLSSWGDRMWSFAVGLYLVILYPESLQLTAIYGFLSSVSAILMGALIGKWVDKTERLKGLSCVHTTPLIIAAQVSLVIQNTFVIICALHLILYLHFEEEMKTIWNGTLGIIVIVCVVLFGIIADLASIGNKLVLEKDWIVVLSGGNEALLSKMNATMRTIDLTTFILAPILVGQIFTFGSHVIGAIFIAAWNILSGGAEYYMLVKIYQSIPQLSQKMKILPKIQIVSPQSVNLQHDAITDANSNDPGITSPTVISDNITFENLSEVSLVTPTSQRFPNDANFENVQVLKPKSTGLFQRYITNLKIKFEESRSGWIDYFLHPIRDAGLGLAFLYMTVLGFDNITTGYAYSQGVSESILGITAALGATFGILGTLLFPCLRKNLGKLVTGNIGFGAETFCLILCLVSILTPGSPFTHRNILSVEKIDSYCNITVQITRESHKSATITELFDCNISVLLLLVGIVSARFGLWVADLSVTQIAQERIPEAKRGVLNGVQGALNQTMNLIKFLIVIILPKSGTFAYLIIASWLFVFLGWILFMIYSWKNRSERTMSSKYSSRIPTVSPVLEKNSSSTGKILE